VVKAIVSSYKIRLIYFGTELSLNHIARAIFEPHCQSYLWITLPLYWFNTCILLFRCNLRTTISVCLSN